MLAVNISNRRSLRQNERGWMCFDEGERGLNAENLGQWRKEPVDDHGSELRDLGFL